ncbi:MAG: hypothetical protein ABI321_11175 [Polyangia bacterium]
MDEAKKTSQYFPWPALSVAMGPFIAKASVRWGIGRGHGRTIATLEAAALVGAGVGLLALLLNIAQKHMRAASPPRRFNPIATAIFLGLAAAAATIVADFL